MKWIDYLTTGEGKEFEHSKVRAYDSGHSLLRTSEITVRIGTTELAVLLQKEKRNPQVAWA